MTKIVNQSGEPVYNLAGEEGIRTDPLYQVSNLGSLFSVCALALEGVGAYREDLRDRLIDEVKLVLQLGAVMALDAGGTVDGALEAAKADRRAA